MKMLYAAAMVAKEVGRGVVGSPLLHRPEFLDGLMDLPHEALRPLLLRHCPGLNFWFETKMRHGEMSLRQINLNTWGFEFSGTVVRANSQHAVNQPATMNPIRLMIQLLLVASASAFATPRSSSLRSSHLRATPDEVANEVRNVVFTLAASAAILKQGFDIIYGSGKTDAKLVEYDKAIDKLSDIPGQLKQLGTDMKGIKADMKQQSTDTNNRMNDMKVEMKQQSAGMNNRMNDMNNRMNDKFDEVIFEVRQWRTETNNAVVKVADDLEETNVKADGSVRLLKKFIMGESTALASRIEKVEFDAERSKKSASRMESLIVDMDKSLNTGLNGLNSTVQGLNSMVQGLSLQVQDVHQAVARLEAAAADAPVPAFDPKRMAKGGRM
jgi:hypothetical protein